MKEVNLGEIREKAHKAHGSGLNWHFHILTPTCAFNKKEKYAFLFECKEKNEYLAYYSDRAERELGQELAPLAHGAKILKVTANPGGDELSAKIQKVILRAKELNQKGIEWHHHVLNPQCQFNKHAPKFIFVFEDPETKETTEELSDVEPTEILEHIEKLFYKR